MNRAAANRSWLSPVAAAALLAVAGAWAAETAPLASSNTPARKDAVVTTNTTPASSNTVSKSGSSGPSNGRSNNVPQPAARVVTGADYSAFSVINDGNIFNPNRRSRSPAAVAVQRQVVVDSFSLVGLMSYEKGQFAVFDGSSSQYKKVLKQGDKIAEYTVTAIEQDKTNNKVKLKGGDKELEFKIGTQLRREDGGEWKLSQRGEGAYASSGSSSSGSSSSYSGSSSSGSSSSGSGGDSIIERMRKRREAEAAGKQ